MATCVFCDIVNKTSPAHIIWEDERHIAFLSIFPNTEGFTVVATKEHLPNYCFDLSDKQLTALTLAAKKVGKLLDEKLEGVGRTGMLLEGFGIDHAHAKLFPMHGTANLEKWKPFLAKQNKFFKQYEGYISSHDCERANDTELKSLAERIKS